MVKVKVDYSDLKNELTQLYNEAYKGVHSTSDNDRRQILSILIEKIRTLKTEIEKL